MTLGPLTTSSSERPDSLAERYALVRALTNALVAPLTAEDCVVQSMPDASPAKWHLAHTTWFFEQFLLRPHLSGYSAFHDRYSYLFNSYYESVGPRHQRPERGLLTRPTLDEVRAYRDYIDERMATLLAHGITLELAEVVELGLQHEQQHQELLLMDVKHLLSCNPLQPAYVERPQESASRPKSLPLQFRSFPEGIYEIGFNSDTTEGFCFDNETPRHREYLQPFALATRLVTNAEYLRFIEERGYERPQLWLSDGWATVQQQEWKRPLYWSEALDSEFTLAGLRALDPATPVSHVSFYEADAYARWANARLPTESEWEVVATRPTLSMTGNFLDGHFRDEHGLHPRPAATSEPHRVVQLFGDLWEWTRSPYSPYPGYRPLPGALGEYNGKFMANQFVLRGGSCVTPQSHVRATYRNFFYPHMRWQFGGIRLARDAHS
jgi:ergothioneine biosynthesis protein EgtB